MQKRFKKADIHHRHLIDYNDIGSNRVRLVFDKRIILCHIDFEQAMDSFCFLTCNLCHMFCGTACRRTKGNSHAKCFKQADNTVESCRFTCTGAAGQHHYFILKGFFYRFTLIIGVRNTEKALKRVDMFIYIIYIFLVAACNFKKFLSRVGLCKIQCRQINCCKVIYRST